MLLIACAGAVCVTGIGALAAAGESAEARYRVARARDYRYYEATGESRLSDADLWDKRMREYGSEDWQATIYVAFRPRSALDSLLLKDKTQDALTLAPSHPAVVAALDVEASHKRTAIRWRSACWALVLAAAAAVIIAWWALWVWLSGRRLSKPV